MVWLYTYLAIGAFIAAVNYRSPIKDLLIITFGWLIVFAIAVYAVLTERNQPDQFP